MTSGRHTKRSYESRKNLLRNESSFMGDYSVLDKQSIQNVSNYEILSSGGVKDNNGG